MKYRVKRISTRTSTAAEIIGAQLTETHYSPNRAATQVSMKYRVKRNQCQDSNINPNSTAGQVRK